MTNEIQDMFANAVSVDHLTDEQVDELLKMFDQSSTACRLDKSRSARKCVGAICPLCPIYEIPRKMTSHI